MVLAIRCYAKFGSSGTVDNYLSFWIDNFHQLGSSLLVLIIVTSVLVPQVIVLEVLCLVSFGFMIEAVDRSNREMKRISNNCMGPILSNVQEALNGRVLSRAMGAATSTSFWAISRAFRSSTAPRTPHPASRTVLCTSPCPC